MRRYILHPGGMLIPICLGMFLWSGICAAAEFTADCIHSNKFSSPASHVKGTHQGMGGKQDFTSKLYVKGKKEREETDRGGGGKSIIITRKDKGIAWLLFPDRKEYMESSLKDGGHMAGFRQPMPDATGKKKSLGKSKVNGYLCDKYQITSSFKRPGNEKPVTSTTTIWESTKFGRPVRIDQKSPMFTSSTELKNIKQSKLSDSLFEIPKGYKKIEGGGGRFGSGMKPHKAK